MNPLFRGYYLQADELVVDNFAGGGGASTGIERAIGRPVDIAINHSAEAIAMHRANHPHTKHFCEDIWEVDPRVACAGRRVGLAWFSPDCTHFSKAKGGQPRSKKTRGLAWVVVRWAREVAPRVIILENVEEFQTWGPLDEAGHPDPTRVGETFREWLAELVGLGYSVEFKSLVAADYGTPTTRRRLFLVARKDGGGIAWPAKTHGPGLVPYRTAAEIIDWSIPVRSIFDRKRPLKEATMRRIAAGVRRYVLEAAKPFIMPVTHPRDARVHSIDEPLRTITAANRGELALVAPLITKHYGGVVGHDVERPIGTITTVDHHSLTTAFLTKFYGTSIGSACDEPLPTITSGGGRGGGHVAAVRAFLIKYYGSGGQAQSVSDPLHTVTAKPRFGLVLVEGVAYEVTDIGMRMLQPSELFAGNGLPSDYIIAPEFRGKPLTKSAQTTLAGNCVCPQVAYHLVAANTREADRMAA